MKSNAMMRVINSANFPSGYYYAFYRKFGLNGGYRAPMLQPSESAMKAIDEATS